MVGEAQTQECSVDTGRPWRYPTLGRCSPSRSFPHLLPLPGLKFQNSTLNYCCSSPLSRVGSARPGPAGPQDAVTHHLGSLVPLCRA